MLACNELNIEERDLLYFIPIFHFFDSRVPIELGEWTGDITIYDSGKKNISNGAPPKAIQNGKITFSNEEIPEVVNNINEFRNFNYIKAIIESEPWPENIRKDGSTIIIDVRLKKESVTENQNYLKQTKEVILVKAEEVIRFL